MCAEAFFFVFISVHLLHTYFIYTYLFMHMHGKKQHRIIIYTILWSPPPTFPHFLPVFTMFCNLFRAFNLGPNFARGATLRY